jgi:uncharacterized SAM-binding protein YcdF (DUF218 family)
MAALLMVRGVPAERILSEETGIDTLSSGRAVVALLRSHAGGVRAFVATSLYHMSRCRLLLLQAVRS